MEKSLKLVPSKVNLTRERVMTIVAAIKAIQLADCVSDNNLLWALAKNGLSLREEMEAIEVVKRRLFAKYDIDKDGVIPQQSNEHRLFSHEWNEFGFQEIPVKLYKIAESEFVNARIPLVHFVELGPLIITSEE